MLTPPIIRLPGGYEAARKAGFGASNGMFVIKIHTGLDCYAGILAQEVYEFRRKWLVGLMMALPVVAALVWFGREIPEALILGGLVSVVLFLFNLRLIPGGLARMELVGHMIEVLVAEKFYGKDFNEYAKSEADLMAIHYDQFKGWGAEKVLSDMLKKRKTAEKWVKKHHKWIAKQVEKGK